MSRAFVKEPEGADAIEDLPDRPISPHPNFVTPDGLKLIDSQLTDLRDRRAIAQAADDRAALAQIARDARYWAARRASGDACDSVPRAGSASASPTMRKVWRRPPSRALVTVEPNCSLVASLAGAMTWAVARREV